MAPAERPAYLCVVARGTRAKLSMGMVAGARVAKQSVPSDEVDIWRFAGMRVEQIREGFRAWAIENKRSPLDEDAAKTLANALYEMRSVAACDSELCGPRFIFRNKDPAFPDMIQCQPNAQRGGTSSVERVAVVLVRALGEDRQPTVDRIELGSSAASLFLTYPDDHDTHDTEISATVIGGHYAEGRTQSDKSKVTLPLVPWCREHQVKLPAMAILQGAMFHVTARSGGHDPAVCEAQPAQDDSRSLRLRLPYELDAKKTVEIELGERGKWGYSRLVAEWNGFEPPQVLVPRFEAVSFAWRRHCLFPIAKDGPSWREKCPKAWLPEVGVTCADPTRDPIERTCQYVCERAQGAGKTGEAHVSFDLPARVRFQREEPDGSGGGIPTDDLWDETLTYSNQPLSGYIRPEDRYVELDFSDWRLGVQELAHRRGDSVSRITIVTATGREHSVTPEDGQRVPAPGGGCAEVFKYTLSGVRPYREEDAKVTQGRLPIKSPNGLGVVFTPGVAFSGGALIHESPGSEYGANVVFFGAGRGILSWWIPSIPMVIEARGGYMLTRQTYYPVTLTPPEKAGVWFHRWPVTVFGTWEFFDDWYVGLGPTLVPAHTGSSTDAARAGGLQLYGGASWVLGHVLPGRYAALELVGDVTGGEKVYAESANRFRGEPVQTVLSSAGVWLGAGIRFGRR